MPRQRAKCLSSSKNFVNFGVLRFKVGALSVEEISGLQRSAVPFDGSLHVVVQ